MRDMPTLNLKTGNSGANLDDCQIKEPARHIPAYAEADKVWNTSEKLVGERFAV